MDFQLSAAQEMLVRSTRRFAQERLAPGAAEREAAHDIGHDVIRALAEQGLLGVNIPGELGGSEAGVVAYALALRELAAADASVAVTMAVTNMVAEVICRFGTAEQHQKYVPNLTSGEYFGGAFGLSEPGSGSDAASLTTRAERVKDGYVLNGQKMWISTGDKAGVIVVWARTGEGGAKGISCFLVDKNTPGLSAGKPEEKMGLRASHTVALNLQDVHVPRSHLLGEEGKGFHIAMAALDGGRIGIGAQSLGMAMAAIQHSRKYALERSQFGKPIADQQAIQFKLADMATEWDAAWMLTMRAAWLKEKRLPFSREAAMAKVFASETANRIIREAVQIFGGYGYIEEYPVARLYRDCRVTQIYEGTSEIQRMVIARDVLKEAAGNT